MNRTVWITGAGGLIGSHLVQAAAKHAPDHRVVGWTRDRLELTDFDAVRRAFDADPPALVFHCAAISKSPVCEADPVAARMHNVEVTSHLATLARDIGFVFLSTDQVFDGGQGNYSEDSRTNPLNVYGRTKCESEPEVLANPRHLVIRTSLNGGISPTGDRGFNEQLRRLWAEGRVMRLFTDEFRSPISAAVTAGVLWDLALSGRSGLYHVAGAERLSRFEMASLLAARWPCLKPVLVQGSLQEHPGPPRAPDTSLDCSKATTALGVELPRFSEWLADQPEGTF